MRRSLPLLVLLLVVWISPGTEAITFEVLDDWERGGACPLGAPVRAGDGNYYGVTTNGGNRDRGVIYRLTSGGKCETVFHLGAVKTADHSAEFVRPAAGLVAGADGSLFGTLSPADGRSSGAIFRFQTSGDFALLHVFENEFYAYRSAATVGRLCAAPDGSLYGMATFGGDGDAGGIFRITSSGSFSVLHPFEKGSIPSFQIGQFAGMMLGSDGAFYGVMPGISDLAFRITSTGEFSTRRFDAPDDANRTIWHAVRSGLSRGTDGDFYGVTTGLYGSLFRLAADGQRTVLYTFKDREAGDLSNPVSELQDGAFLCAARFTPFQGVKSLGRDTGAIYRITEGGPANLAHHFLDDNENQPCKLVEGGNGTLYGVTRRGGTYGLGTFFKLSPGQAHVVLHDFEPTEGGIVEGSVLRGDDGNFYGIRGHGWTHSTSADVIVPETAFRLTPAGEYTRIYTFTDNFSYSLSMELAKGSDGDFYGTYTTYAQNQPTVSSFQLTSTGDFSVVASFPEDIAAVQSAVTGLDGSSYETSVYDEHRDEQRFLGVGSILRIAPTGERSAVHYFDFDVTDETFNEKQFGPLLRTADGRIFGTAAFAGPRGGGIVFELHPDRTTAQTKPATAVMPTRTTLIGSVVPATLPTSACFEYGRTAELDSRTPAVPLGSGANPVDFAAQVGFLPHDTTVYFRAVAIRGGAEERGPVLMFTTIGNSAPIAANDVAWVRPGGAVEVDVIRNDSDPDDGDVLTAELASLPQFGTAHVETGGRILYQSGPRFGPSDSFTYTLHDDFGGTASATVVVRNRFGSGRSSFAPGLLRGGVPVGTLRLDVTASGAFSGSLRLDGTRVSLRSSFDAEGTSALPLTAAGHHYEIHLALDPMSGELSGTVCADGEVLVLASEKPLAAEPTRNAPAGRYTLLLSPPDAAETPRGCGWAIMVIDRHGAVRLCGRMGNGEAWSTATTLRIDEAVPVFAVAGVQNRLAGTLHFRSLAGSDCDGSLAWSGMWQPVSVEGANPAVTIAAIGSHYLPPAGGAQPLFFGTSAHPTADFAGDSIAGERVVLFTPRGAMALQSAGDLWSFALDRRTGVFSGVVAFGGARTRFSGALFQRSNSGHGVSFSQRHDTRGREVIDRQSSGSIRLVPR